MPSQDLGQVQEFFKNLSYKILIVDKMGANVVLNVRTNVQLFKDNGMCFNLFTIQKTFKVAYILAYVASPTKAIPYNCSILLPIF